MVYTSSIAILINEKPGQKLPFVLCFVHTFLLGFQPLVISEPLQIIWIHVAGASLQDENKSLSQPLFVPPFLCDVLPLSYFSAFPTTSNDLQVVLLDLTFFQSKPELILQFYLYMFNGLPYPCTIMAVFEISRYNSRSFRFLPN